MNKLLQYKLLFVLSTVSVTASFLVVLLITYYLVVPYRLATELVLTECTVVALTPVRTLAKPCSGHMITNLPDIPSAPEALVNPRMCLEVRVAYVTRTMDNKETYHLGILSNIAASGSLSDEIRLARYKERGSTQHDCCSGCLSDSQDTPYTNCTMMLSHHRASMTLHQHQPLFCYYQRSLSSVLVKDHNSMVNIILWPTVLFILGFVTMFISYIKLQQQKEVRKKKKKKQMSMSLLKNASQVSL